MLRVPNRSNDGNSLSCSDRPLNTGPVEIELDELC